MMRLFQDLITDPEKKLTARADEMGGMAAVLEDEHAMEALAEEEFVLVEPDRENRRDRSFPFNFFEVRREIKANPEEAIEKNVESFNRKFEMQKQQIVKEITLALSKEGSRIISAAAAGPHDRVVYPVWLQMFGLYATHILPVAFRICITSGKTW